MATLEKIRSKSVLLFTIIIVALLAFILGDFLTSGRSYFGTGDTVASAKGVKVDYNTYRDRLNRNSEAQKNQNRPQDSDVLSEQTVEELLLEALLNQEYDKMGISVTDKQLSKLMLGEETGPGIYASLLQQFGQAATALQQKGIVDVRNYYDAMKTPSKYGLTAEEGQMLTSVWSDLEKSIDDNIRAQAYGVLIQGLFSANKVDAQAMYNDRNTTSHFAYVRKDFTSIPDDEIKITNEDYKAAYDERKGLYKIDEEQRLVSFIAVPIVPSDADFAKGQKEVETLIAELNTTEGTEALTNHPEFTSSTGKYTREAMGRNPQLRMLGADTVGLHAGLVQPLLNLGGKYTIAKIIDITSGVDNVTFSAFGGTAGDLDSLMTKTTAATFDSIATANGGRTGIQMSLVTPQFSLPESQLTALAEKPVGQIFVLNDTIQSQDEAGKITEQVYSTAFLISSRDAAVPVYEIAEITYQVVPSQATINDLSTKFHAYVGNNANSKAFAENAEKSGYTVGTAMVSASTPIVGNSPNSRGAVKWAMKNKKDKVSPVFNLKGTQGVPGSSDDYLFAISVDDVYSGSYIPYDSKIVQDQLKPYILNEKKAEKLIKQYSGKAKDIQGYATAMNAAMGEADAVFGDDQIPQVGYAETALQGKVAAAEKGKLVGPFKGNNAIYVITVQNTDKQGRPFDLNENQQAFASKFVSALMNDPLRLLVGDSKVKNNVLEFVADEVN